MGQKGTGSRIRIRNNASWKRNFNKFFCNINSVLYLAVHPMSDSVFPVSQLMDGDIIVYQLEPAPEAEYELPTAREYYRELFYRVRYYYSMVLTHIRSRYG